MTSPLIYQQEYWKGIGLKTQICSPTQNHCTVSGENAFQMVYNKKCQNAMPGFLLFGLIKLDCQKFWCQQLIALPPICMSVYNMWFCRVCFSRTLHGLSKEYIWLPGWDTTVQWTQGVQFWHGMEIILVLKRVSMFGHDHPLATLN